VRVFDKERHLAFRIATISALCVSLDEFPQNDELVSLLNSWRHDESGRSHHVHLLAANPLALTRFASLAEASMLNALHSRDEPGRSVMTSNC
jgi:hypothetical protein